MIALTTLALQVIFTELTLMKMLPRLILLVTALALQKYGIALAEETSQCMNLNSSKAASTLATVEMKRQIPYLFQGLVKQTNLLETQASLEVYFEMDGQKQPTNIHILKSSGNTAIDNQAISAVQLAGPYRQAGGCFTLPLSVTLTPQSTDNETDYSSNSIGGATATASFGRILVADPNIKNQYIEPDRGNDTIDYYRSMEGHDIINDIEGHDTLKFGTKQLKDAAIKALDGLDSDNNIDSLLLDFGAGNSVTILHYFDNQTTDVTQVKPGAGLIEDIIFNDGKILHFNDVKHALKAGEVGKVSFEPSAKKQDLISKTHPERSQVEKDGSIMLSVPDGLPTRKSKTQSTPGITTYNQSNSKTEPDFGPYVAELQRRIRRNWSCPVEERNKRVIVQFKISRVGRLLDLKIKQSAGFPSADQAAIAAVRQSAPFPVLPPAFRGNDISVQFIFDYEIQGHGNARMR